MKYDSVHGTFDAEVATGDDHITVDGRVIRVTAEPNPGNAKWGEFGVSVVLEATGRFLDRDKAAQHLQAGAKKVLLSAPSKGKAADATICYGINQGQFSPDMEVISTASCTTNCLAPVVSLLNDNFGVEQGLMTTVHAYTNDQRILDLPHADMRRARAAGTSMIPTTTGAAKALALVLPEMAGRLDGMAIRVPTPCVSLVDLVVNLREETTAQAINDVFAAAAAGSSKASWVALPNRWFLWITSGPTAPASWMRLAPTLSTGERRKCWPGTITNGGLRIGPSIS